MKTKKEDQGVGVACFLCFEDSGNDVQKLLNFIDVLVKEFKLTDKESKILIDMVKNTDADERLLLEKVFDFDS